MKLTIRRKLFIGFFALVISMAVMFALTQRTLNKNEQIIDEITRLRNPSLYAIEDLVLEIEDIKSLTNQWGVVQSDPDTDNKKTLIDILDNRLPATRKILDSLSVYWEEKDQIALERINGELDTLVWFSKHVVNSLSSFAAYNDPLVVMEVDFLLSSGGEFDVYSNRIMEDVEVIHATHRKYARNANFEMVESFNDLNTVVLWVGIPLTLSGFLIAFLTVQNFTVPILRLKDLLLKMALGVNSEKILYKTRDDEVGEIARAIAAHKEALDRKIDYAAKIGSGVFDAQYQPASEDDEMGFALVDMSANLDKLTNNLENLVKERTEVIHSQKEEIEEKNRAIFSSISYALTIQQAILPEKSKIAEVADDSFILFKPRDIVSGDFYWFYDLNETHPGEFLIAAIDCTGHGIPGAFMSMIGYNLLNRIVKEGVVQPDLILSKLHFYIREALRQDRNESKDGMDMVLYRIDRNQKKFYYSGAKNPLFYIQNGEIVKERGTRNAIGGSHQVMNQAYGLTEVSYADSFVMIYMYSDGYQDQFGGDNRKKFLSKRFEQLLFEISSQPCDQQEKRLIEELNDWQRDCEQIDDILVMGLRLS